MKKLTKEEVIAILEAAREKKERADFSNMNLSGLDLSGLDLSGLDFSYTDLTRANGQVSIKWDGADLTGANLRYANFYRR